MTLLRTTDGPLLRHLSDYAESCKADAARTRKAYDTLRRHVSLFLYLEPKNTRTEALARGLEESEHVESERPTIPSEPEFHPRL